MVTEEELHSEFVAWRVVQKLPQKTPLELLRGNITDDQREFLMDFIQRYQNMTYRDLYL
jgi:hypothetical protein